MWYAENAEQRRLTVLVRAILLIPHFVVLFFLEFAMVFVAIIGWFAALFTGRLPAWAGEYMSGVLRWVTRVNAYALLLTNRYPPFTLTDEPYPVRPIFPPTGPLNRWAVFFRLILVIPAEIFYTIVAYGLTIPLIVITWVIVLIRGRMPASLYSVYSALVRYEIRVSGYFFMLTSEYAWGMLGDREVHEAGPGTVSLASYPPPAGAAVGGDAPDTGTLPPGQQSQTQTPPSSWESAGSQPTGDSEPDATPEPEAGIGAEPPYGQPERPSAYPPPAYPSPGQPPPAQPPVQSSSWPPPAPSAGADVGSMPPPGPSERAPEVARSGAPGWARLVLGGAARKWMIFAIVWGSILYAGQLGVQAAFRGHNSTVNQYNSIVTDFNATHTSINGALLKAQTCTTVSCLRDSHLNAADSLSRFHDDLQGMDFPSNASNSARQVENDTHKLATIFRDLAHSSDAATYRATVTNSNLEGILSSYPNHTQNLLNDIRSSF